jgi:glycosyltransferase involved in cell wall biosynthesis
MSLYMQCGVPFIAFDYPGYLRLATEDRCGVVIHDLSELPSAITTILGSQETFRHRAYQAFCKHYDLTANFANVRRVIERVCASGEED